MQLFFPSSYGLNKRQEFHFEKRISFPYIIFFPVVAKFLLSYLILIIGICCLYPIV